MGMGKLGNTLAMLKILETGKKYTVKELSEIIEVSPRMIKAYKADLEQAGIYIDTINGIYGGYVYNHKNDYNISFDIHDVNCIERLLPYINDSKYKIDLEKLLEKIKTIVIYSNSDKNNQYNMEDIKEKYNLISKAIKDGTDLKIEYKNKEKNIIPYNFSFYKNFIYITGFSKNDDDLRTYNLNEIKIK